MRKQRHAKQAAFELLDALTRSGALPMSHAALHIVVGAAHSFQDTLMATILRRNVNPIEHVERSSVILASTLWHQPGSDLVQPSQMQRLLEHSIASNVMQFGAHNASSALTVMA